MAKIKCGRCGYVESDGREHDRSTYYELCQVCAPKIDPARLCTYCGRSWPQCMCGRPMVRLP